MPSSILAGYRGLSPFLEDDFEGSDKNGFSSPLFSAECFGMIELTDFPAFFSECSFSSSVNFE